MVLFIYVFIFFHFVANFLEQIFHQNMEEIKEDQGVWVMQGQLLQYLSSFYSNFEGRTFYFYALQKLPGVVRAGKPLPVIPEVISNHTQEPWRHFNRYRPHLKQSSSFSFVLVSCWPCVCMYVCVSAWPVPGCTWSTWSQRCTTHCALSWLLILCSEELPWYFWRSTSLFCQR